MLFPPFHLSHARYSTKQHCYDISILITSVLEFKRCHLSPKILMCVCSIYTGKIENGKQFGMHRFLSDSRACRVWISRCKNASPMFVYKNWDQLPYTAAHLIISLSDRVCPDSSWVVASTSCSWKFLNGSTHRATRCVPGWRIGECPRWWKPRGYPGHNTESFFSSNKLRKVLE